MAGIPAGFEDEFSDEDFEFNDETYNNYYVDTYKNETSQSAIPNVNPFGFVQQNIGAFEEQICLESEDFRLAILKNDVSYVDQALKKGFKSDTILKSGWSALFYAASNGSIEIVKVLLANNASVNLKCESYTPLMAVCQSSSKDEDLLAKCAECLIENGAQVNDHDKHLMTPLMYASKQGFSKLVKLLCEHNASKDHQETRGWTAICFAASHGHSHIVRVLLESGANHEITAFDGQKPMDLAFSNGYTMLSDMLESYDGNNAHRLDEIPSESHSAFTTPSSKFVNYGDLELFLFGLELGHLVPRFQEHRLTFVQLLKLTEEELIEIGITQLGARKKLYTALQDVRTNEWDTSNLSTENISKLTTLETAAVIGNVAKHLVCVQSCVTYVHKVINQRKDQLTADNRNLQKTLIQQSGVACELSKSLNKELTNLNVDLVKLFPNADMKSADYIGQANSKSSYFTKRNIIFTMALCCVVGMSGSVAYKALVDGKK